MTTRGARGSKRGIPGAVLVADAVLASGLLADAGAGSRPRVGRLVPHRRTRFGLLLGVCLLFLLCIPAPAFALEWSVGQVVPYGAFEDVSCPSMSLCVAFGGHPGGEFVATSTNPAAGSGSWSFGSFPQGDQSEGVSCASTSLCVATDRDGAVLTSTNPTGGASTWKLAQVVAKGSDLSGVSCAPATTMCVAVDDSGQILSTTNPVGGASTWSVVRVPAGPLAQVSCASASFCAAPIWAATS